MLHVALRCWYITSAFVELSKELAACALPVWFVLLEPGGDELNRLCREVTREWLPEYVTWGSYEIPCPLIVIAVASLDQAKMDLFM